MSSFNIFESSQRPTVASKDNVFALFLINSGLYDKIEITETNVYQLLDLIGGKVNIDVFCPLCNENRVFHGTAIPYYFPTQGKIYKFNLDDQISGSLGQKLSKPKLANSSKSNFKWVNETLANETHTLTFKYICSMEDSHRLDYIVVIEGNVMTKIGQFPSVADLSFPELKEYKRIISNQDLMELKRAIGLNAQGIGIGSFVYLRRIFERIIHLTSEKAIAEGKIDEELFNKSRIAERIEMLKDYLPTALVNNTVFYGVVSKGIHELSEEECLEYFPILKSFIFLVLRQWEKNRKDSEDEKELSNSLQRISEKVK